MKRALIFPGQGAQYVGMGKEFYDHHPRAKEVFDLADAVLGSAFIDTIFTGPEEKLKMTEYTQPAILTVSIAIFRALEANGCVADGFAGLSLGEYSALVAAGAIEFREALPLVQKRGIFMQEAVPAGAGTMMAIMGISHEQLDQICKDASDRGLVAPANYNCPGQTVISGHVDAVNKAVELARQAGAKRISPLKVSAPFHCALLKPVEERLLPELKKINIKKPSAPIVFNYTAKSTAEPDEIRQNLINQVSNPILWEQSVRFLVAMGIDHFIGIGPGNSLSRLMKRIAPELKADSLETSEDLVSL